MSLLVHLYLFSSICTAIDLCIHTLLHHCSSLAGPWEQLYLDGLQIGKHLRRLFPSGPRSAQERFMMIMPMIMIMMIMMLFVFLARYGRYMVFLVSQIVIILSGLISAFSPNYPFYACMRALTGLFVPGVCVQVFVLASEFVGSRYRPLTGILLWAFFALGLVLLGTKAYFIRKWRILVVVCTAPYTVLLIFHK